MSPSKILLRLPEETVARIKVIAERNHRSMQKQLEHWIERMITEEGAP